ncbi:MAG: GAF domain-containing protein [Planctomycetota bacterium]|jgi:GAF domain-containing protein
MSAKTALDIPLEVIGSWQSVVNTITNVLRVSSTSIMKFDGEGVEVFITSHNSRNTFSAGEKFSFRDNSICCEKVIKTGKKLHISHAWLNSEWKESLYIKRKMISYLGLPIVLNNGETFGVLCMIDNKQNHFEEDDKNLAVSFRDLITNQLHLINSGKQNEINSLQLIEEVSRLQKEKGFVTMCAWCKKIYSGNQWHPLEIYSSQNPVTQVSHGICCECMKTVD